MGLLAVVDLQLEVTDLSVDVEPKTSTASKLEYLLSRTPIIFGAIPNTDGIWVAVKFAVVYAGNAID